MTRPEPIRSRTILVGLSRTLFGVVRDHPGVDADTYRGLVVDRYETRGWPPVPDNWSVRGALNHLVACGDLTEVDVAGEIRWITTRSHNERTNDAQPDET